MVLTFKEFTILCINLEKENGRLEKIRILSNFLNKLNKEEIAPLILLLSGKIFPENSEKNLDMGYASIWRALSNKSRYQVKLFKKPVTLLEVYYTLEKISQIKGEKSKRKKERYFASLASRLSNIEIEYLLRVIFKEMRIGVNEGIILEALSKITNIEIDVLRRAYMLIGDIGQLATLALTESKDKILNTKLELFRPVKPMLAEMAHSIKEALKNLGGSGAFEFKYDGIRVQVHKNCSDIKIFTRRFTDITKSLPDLVRRIKENANIKTGVLDGEAIGYKNGKPIRFQDLVRRIRRQRALERFIRKIPLDVKFFDILYMNNKMLVDLPYYKRWNILKKVVPKNMLAERIISDNLTEISKFMKRSIKLGYEGIMAKKLNSPYLPGIRGKYWFKIKTSDTIDLVIVAADWGHGRREKWLSDYYLAARDEKTGEYLVVGKTFKGLTDEEFKEITNKLLNLKIDEHEYTVRVIPKIVVEVAFNEIQKSPKYKSGFALRFARIVRIRYDKLPEDTATLDDIRRRYKQQFLRKEKIN